MSVIVWSVARRRQMSYSMRFEVIAGPPLRSVEVMHHKRDVTLSEDGLRSGKVGVNRLVSSCRTLAINLLEGMGVKNMAAQLDLFADKFTTLIQFLTQQMVL